MMDVPYELVKNEMVRLLSYLHGNGYHNTPPLHSQKTGVAVPSYTSALLESNTNPLDGSVLPEDEEDIKGSAGTLYAGKSFKGLHLAVCGEVLKLCYKMRSAAEDTVSFGFYIEFIRLL
jgi:hypothetical protein